MSGQFKVSGRDSDLPEIGEWVEVFSADGKKPRRAQWCGFYPGWKFANQKDQGVVEGWRPEGPNRAMEKHPASPANLTGEAGKKK